MDQSIDRVIRTIDLVKSDARDQAINGIVEYILFAIKESCSLKDLNEYISLEYGFQLHHSELEASVASLIDVGSITSKPTKTYELTNTRYLELEVANKRAQEADVMRFNRFSKRLDHLSKAEVNGTTKKKLWGVFSNYLYTCYLEYGRNVIYSFRPDKETRDIQEVFDVNKILRSHIEPLSTSERELFTAYVESFTERLNSEELDYLTSLANKAEAFFSLGLSQNDYEKLVEKVEFNWTIFVDTNFLYSILDLHSHPENPACTSVLSIGKELGIKFKYLPGTLRELDYKRNEFEKTIDKSLKRSHVQALVNSGKLDNFTQRHFERKLLDWSNTPHPTDIINHAQTILTQHGIEIYRNKLEGLKKRESHLLDQESHYADYLRMIDEIRMEKGMKPKSKDTEKIAHDTFLREVILYHRESKPSTFSSIKHFGLTLDRTLLSFDRAENRKNQVGFVIPTFFRPSVLLGKLLKYIPLQTEDYRRAYLSTISTPALDNNAFVSRVAVRTTRYFMNLGVTDEKLIIDCLKDELFLDKIRAVEGDDPEIINIVESEINKKYQELVEEREGLLSELEDKDIQFKQEKVSKDKIKNERNKLSSQVSSLENQINIYSKYLRKLKNEVRKGQIEKPADQIPIAHEQLESEIEKLKKVNEQQKEKIAAATKAKKDQLHAILRWTTFIVLSLALSIIAWVNPYSVIPPNVNHFWFRFFLELLIISITINIPLPRHWKIWLPAGLVVCAILVAIALG